MHVEEVHRNPQNASAQQLLLSVSLETIFGSFSKCDDLGLGAGKGDRLLLLGTEEDGRLLPADKPTGGRVSDSPVGVGEGIGVGGCGGIA